MDSVVTFTVLSLFPEILEAFFSSSIMARSIEKGLVSYNPVQIRDYSKDKHHNCDDLPYGGGPGMVLKAEPLAGALDAVHAGEKRVIYTSPGGKLLTQAYAEELSREDELVIICGRYEGIDQRIIDEYVDDEISIGDYVLSSGETAALAIIDSIYRLLEGVINEDSLDEESHTKGLLEYPHYTRPESFRGREVPKVLMSGHHAHIAQWRLEQSISKTMRNRPELVEKAVSDPAIARAYRKLIQSTEDQGGIHGPY